VTVWKELGTFKTSLESRGFCRSDAGGGATLCLWLTPAPFRVGQWIKSCESFGRSRDLERELIVTPSLLFWSLCTVAAALESRDVLSQPAAGLELRAAEIPLGPLPRSSSPVLSHAAWYKVLCDTVQRVPLAFAGQGSFCSVRRVPLALRIRREVSCNFTSRSTLSLFVILTVPHYYLPWVEGYVRWAFPCLPLTSYLKNHPAVWKCSFYSIRLLLFPRFTIFLFTGLRSIGFVCSI
jgi:hypothetical protein